MLKRIGLIGDVHGRAGRLEDALLFLTKARDAGDIDSILCTGDIPGKRGFGDTNRCAALLQAANVEVICGNHDFWAIENVSDPLMGLYLDETQLSRDTIAYFKTLPRTRSYETPRGMALFCHGMGDDFMAGIYPWSVEDTEKAAQREAEIQRVLVYQNLYEKYAYHIAGHTHQRLFRTVGTITLVNPGSLLGDKDAPGFAILDTETNTFKWHDLA
jgi:predicted phosphodiesterase